MDNQQDYFDSQEPGEIDMILGAHITNPYKDKSLTIISGEFESLNKKIIGPGQLLDINIMVPAGFREYIKPTVFKGKPYIYIGLRDKNAAEPMLYKPNV